MTTRGQHQVSVTAPTFARIKAEADARGLRLGDVIDAAIDGQWPDENPRIAALMAKPSTHVSLEQRCSLDVSEAVMSLVDDRLARLRELHGVDMTRAELFDRVVNAVLDGEHAE